MADTFKPALIIVDLQEDFCPPNGSLAVTGGRDTVSIINHLLSFPFTLKIATKDWHPQSHISFASNHPGKKPFVDFATIVNPENGEEKYESRLWPDHCVQHTKGAELIGELDVGKVDRVVEKGMDERVEMYSAFYTPFVNPRVADSGLAGVLHEKGITDVFVVGLAADYCVKCTAADAAKEGFKTYIVEEGTRPVDGVEWASTKGDLGKLGVKAVSCEGEEVKRVAELSQ